MRKDKGITLIALIVMIIVLLILAGITLGTINNNGGTIKHTRETSQSAQRESIIQKIEADLYNEKIKAGEIHTKEKLREIISNNYGTIDKEGENEMESFTSNTGGYQIEFSEIEGWKNK